MRRVKITVTQTNIDIFECEVPDDMDDAEALERFRELQIWASEDPHETVVDNQEMEVGPGYEHEKYPFQIGRNDA